MLAVPEKFNVGKVQTTDLVKNKDAVNKLRTFDGNDKIKIIKRLEKAQYQFKVDNIVKEWFCVALNIFQSVDQYLNNRFYKYVVL